MKIFVDTNIFLDLILKREKFHDALLIFNAIEKKLFEGIILDITILNIDYVAKKQVKNIKDFIKLINSNVKQKLAKDITEDDEIDDLWLSKQNRK